ncbi:putative Response regulator receiver protein [Candidatus Defluviicoccus seviourii]|uniref:Response regulator receiver protein n=2 Tax=root TaxID=1 RepID=A0A564WCT7_9PROT|nr:putative Response regulator receiver protein [Candidatus Defluviicoccus seviourii]
MQRSTVLLVRSDDEVESALIGPLTSLAGGKLEVMSATSLDDAFAILAAGKADVVVAEAASDDDGALLQRITALHQHSTRTPIVVIAPAINDRFIEKARRSGAQHVLQREEALHPLVLSVVRGALHDARADALSAEEEIRGLGALSGPAPSPITGRSLGMQSLREKTPDEFESLLNAYDTLLDMLLERQACKLVDDFETRLLRFAERLGMINAGPRDVVAIHKAAIAAKISREPAMRTKAYFEEGRLLILQVMGHLASFYRSLSWGKAPTAGSPTSATDGSFKASRT